MTVLEEAASLVDGDRLADYGTPASNWGRTAALINAAFHHKLKEPLTPADCVLMMILVKVARQAHKHKRDTLTDIAAYSHIIDLLES